MRTAHQVRITAARGGTIALLVTLSLLVMNLGGRAGSAPAPATAFVRVNQVGYPLAASKRAYLMASGAETGASFSVRNAAGTIVFSGPVGANLGSWSSAYPGVFALDFDSVSAAGTYTISVAGPIPATSPSFRIDSGAGVYGGALENALAFYQTERDGPNFITSPLRTAPAHLNDQTAMTYLTPHVNSAGRFSGDLTPLGIRVDGSGGWWDAGDYIKGKQTLGYTTALLLSGVRDFPAQMGAGSTASDFTAEARFGTDWLLRMWDDPTRTFYYQVGIGTGNAKTVGDHDIWRLPQADDTFGGTDPLYRYIRNRPVFRAGEPGSLISPNLAGRDAAVFGLCYQVFKTSDPAFANKCLLAGQHIFDLANTAPSSNLTTYIPFSSYPETEWRSDLELGAVQLYFAVASGGLPAGLPHTDPLFYLQKAAHWPREYVNSPDDADTQNARWLGNILGANAWGSSFIIGDGSTFPRCPHHQVANLVGSLDGTPPVLRGAAVEGPNGTLYRGFQTGMRNCPPDDSDPFASFSSTAKFKDDIESFSTVEPAVDLTATSPLAFARQAAGLL